MSPLTPEQKAEAYAVIGVQPKAANETHEPGRIKQAYLAGHREGRAEAFEEARFAIDIEEDEMPPSVWLHLRSKFTTMAKAARTGEGE